MGNPFPHSPSRSALLLRQRALVKGPDSHAHPTCRVGAALGKQPQGGRKTRKSLESPRFFDTLQSRQIDGGNTGEMSKPMRGGSVEARDRDRGAKTSEGKRQERIGSRTSGNTGPR